MEHPVHTMTPEEWKVARAKRIELDKQAEIERERRHRLEIDQRAHEYLGKFWRTANAGEELFYDPEGFFIARDVIKEIEDRILEILKDNGWKTESRFVERNAGLRPYAANEIWVVP